MGEEIKNFCFAIRAALKIKIFTPDDICNKTGMPFTDSKRHCENMVRQHLCSQLMPSCNRRIFCFHINEEECEKYLFEFSK